MINFESFKFKGFSVNEGLSQNTVYSIIQDKKGFMWFCTQQGLNKYDGYKFTVFKNIPADPNSLQNNFIYNIYEDSDNNLWVSSFNGLISRYNYEENNFDNYQIPENAGDIPTNYSINGFAENNNSELYLATSEIGLIIFNLINKNFYSFDFGTDKFSSFLKEISSLLIDDSGDLWLGTWNNGLYKYSDKKKELVNYNFEINNENSLSNDRVRFIFQDSKKNLWMGTSNGLNLYDKNNNFFKRYNSDSSNSFEVNKNTFSCIEEDKNGNLWIGTKNSGLIKFNPENNYFTYIKSDQKDPSGLGADNIMTLYSDNSNTLWIGTFNSGIYKLDCEEKKFYGISNLIDKNKFNPLSDVTALLKDNSENLWIGTTFNGLFKINILKNELEDMKDKIELLKNQNHQTVTCLYSDHKDILWVGTLFHGLNKICTKIYKAENYLFSDKAQDNYMSSLAGFTEGGEERIWVATKYKGLLIFDKAEKKFSALNSLKMFENSMPQDEVKCLFMDKKEMLWVGTENNGLKRIDFRNRELSNFLKDETKKNSFISCINESSDNILWIGTLYNGLYNYSKEKNRFKNFTTEDGLCDNSIRGILTDDGDNIWISTTNGLSKFDRARKVFRNYDVNDGLQSREFNDGACYKDKDGVMYFGGVNGFNFFKPEEIKDNPYIPNIVITDFQIFNHSVNNSPDNPFLRKNIAETDEITLTYRESVFSFEFAALIYNNSQKNQYAYMMEGFDKDWIYCGTRRQATYTNLDHGEYIFRVKGSNNDGIWNEEGTSIKIIITPPFWKTWWFRTLGLMSIAGATGLAYRQKLSKVEKEKKSQEEFSRILLDSQETERKRISTELHDTIAHDILITKNKAVMALRKSGDKTEVEKILNEISDLASDTLNDVRTISYNLHPHQIERLGITKAIKSILNNAGNSTDIEFSDSIHSIDNLLKKELEINIFRIVQECINNIIKHSSATKASFSLIKDNKTLLITIWDNGKGIPKNRKDGIGLSGIAERLKLYNGELHIEAVQSNGTLLVITLPILKLE